MPQRHALGYRRWVLCLIELRHTRHRRSVSCGASKRVGPANRGQRPDFKEEASAFLYSSY